MLSATFHVVLALAGFLALVSDHPATTYGLGFIVTYLLFIAVLLPIIPIAYINLLRLSNDVHGRMLSLKDKTTNSLISIVKSSFPSLWNTAQSGVWLDDTTSHSDAIFHHYSIGLPFQAAPNNVTGVVRLYRGLPDPVASFTDTSLWAIPFAKATRAQCMELDYQRVDPSLHVSPSMGSYTWSLEWMALAQQAVSYSRSVLPRDPNRSDAAIFEGIDDEDLVYVADLFPIVKFPSPPRLSDTATFKGIADDDLAYLAGLFPIIKSPSPPRPSDTAIFKGIDDADLADLAELFPIVEPPTTAIVSVVVHPIAIDVGRTLSSQSAAESQVIVITTSPSPLPSTLCEPIRTRPIIKFKTISKIIAHFCGFDKRTWAARMASIRAFKLSCETLDDDFTKTLANAAMLNTRLDIINLPFLPRITKEETLALNDVSGISLPSITEEEQALSLPIDNEPVRVALAAPMVSSSPAVSHHNEKPALALVAFYEADTEESVAILHDHIQYIANGITSPTVTPATPSVSSETSVTTSSEASDNLPYEFPRRSTAGLNIEPSVWRFGTYTIRPPSYHPWFLAYLDRELITLTSRLREFSVHEDPCDEDPKVDDLAQRLGGVLLEDDSDDQSEDSSNSKSSASNSEDEDDYQDDSNNNNNVSSPLPSPDTDAQVVELDTPIDNRDVSASHLIDATPSDLPSASSDADAEDEGSDSDRSDEEVVPVPIAAASVDDSASADLGVQMQENVDSSNTSELSEFEASFVGDGIDESDVDAEGEDDADYGYEDVIPDVHDDNTDVPSSVLSPSPEEPAEGPVLEPAQSEASSVGNAADEPNIVPEAEDDVQDDTAIINDANTDAPSAVLPSSPDEHAEGQVLEQASSEAWASEDSGSEASSIENDVDESDIDAEGEDDADYPSEDDIHHAIDANMDVSPAVLSPSPEHTEGNVAVIDDVSMSIPPVAINTFISVTTDVPAPGDNAPAPFMEIDVDGEDVDWGFDEMESEDVSFGAVPPSNAKPLTLDNIWDDMDSDSDMDEQNNTTATDTGSGRQPMEFDSEAAPGSHDLSASSIVSGAYVDDDVDLSDAALDVPSVNVQPNDEPTNAPLDDTPMDGRDRADEAMLASADDDDTEPHGNTSHHPEPDYRDDNEDNDDEGDDEDDDEDDDDDDDFEEVTYNSRPSRFLSPTPPSSRGATPVPEGDDEDAEGVDPQEESDFLSGLQGVSLEDALDQYDNDYEGYLSSPSSPKSNTQPSAPLNDASATIAPASQPTSASTWGPVNVAEDDPYNADNWWKDDEEEEDEWTFNPGSSSEQPPPSSSPQGLQGVLSGDVFVEEDSSAGAPPSAEAPGLEDPEDADVQSRTGSHDDTYSWTGSETGSDGDARSGTGSDRGARSGTGSYYESDGDEERLVAPLPRRFRRSRSGSPELNTIGSDIEPKTPPRPVAPLPRRSLRSKIPSPTVPDASSEIPDKDVSSSPPSRRIKPLRTGKHVPGPSSEAMRNKAESEAAMVDEDVEDDGGVHLGKRSHGDQYQEPGKRFKGDDPPDDLDVL